MKKRDIIDQHHFFSGASESERQKIAESAALVHIPEGKCVFSTGAGQDAVALLGSGKIRVFIVSETGREITLYYVEPGESCPTNLMCSLFDRPSPAEAVPVEPCEALLIPNVGPRTKKSSPAITVLLSTASLPYKGRKTTLE